MPVIIIFKMIGMNKLYMPHRWKIMQLCDEEKQNGMKKFYGPGYNTTIKHLLRQSIPIHRGSVQNSIQYW